LGIVETAPRLKLVAAVANEMPAAGNRLVRRPCMIKVEIIVDYGLTEHSVSTPACVPGETRAAKGAAGTDTPHLHQSTPADLRRAVRVGV
jgi:hypothetical protein